jgi:hypothetical protein
LPTELDRLASSDCIAIDLLDCAGIEYPARERAVTALVGDLGSTLSGAHDDEAVRLLRSTFWSRPWSPPIPGTLKGNAQTYPSLS